MPFVHSLVKTKVKEKTGWCAPIELGEDAPHYISFVIPLDDRGDFFLEYTCETITFDKEGATKIDAHEFVRQGKDSFVLRLGQLNLWFTVRAVPRENRHLPYVGKLGHADFASLFTEIEPEQPKKLDQLYNEDGFTFVIGCDAFIHYTGIPVVPS
jgi:hypothetical protein